MLEIYGYGLMEKGLSRNRFLLEKLRQNILHINLPIKRTDMDYNKTDIRYAKNLLNDMLICILGVPKKYVGNRSFGGYWSLMNKWIFVDKYDLAYIYFVVQRLQNKKINMTAGFIEGALRSKNWIKAYDPEEHKLPSGGQRDKLLGAGHTIETLPLHLLTREERKKRKQYEVDRVEVTDEDRKALSELLTGAGGVIGNRE